MKKKYISPETQVFAMEIQGSMLAGHSNDMPNAKRYNTFYDEEEETYEEEPLFKPVRLWDE